MGSGGENDPTTAPDAEGEAEASAPSGPTVKMHRADTPTDMTNVATEISTEAIRRHPGAWREAAAYIKKVRIPERLRSRDADSTALALLGSHRTACEPMHAL